MRSVGEVKRFEAKLPANSLGQAELAEQREVQIHVRWTAEEIAPHRSIGCSGRVRKNTRRTVEPLSTRANSAKHLEISDQIRAVAVAGFVQAGGTDAEIQRQA